MSDLLKNYARESKTLPIKKLSGTKQETQLSKSAHDAIVEALKSNYPELLLSKAEKNEYRDESEEPTDWTEEKPAEFVRTPTRTFAWNTHGREMLGLQFSDPLVDSEIARIVHLFNSELACYLRLKDRKVDLDSVSCWQDGLGLEPFLVSVEVYVYFRTCRERVLLE